MTHDFATAQSGCAWVTGASSGIGRALCARLITKGWHVAGSARDNGALVTLRSELGDRFHPFPLDITELAGVRSVVIDIEQKLGPIELAILNAGVYQLEGDGGFDGNSARCTFAVNVMGTVNCLDVLVHLMKSRSHGQIALMSSVAGYRGLPRATAYNASRSAILSLAESLKFELDRHGVNVQVITPGFVDTPMTKKNQFPMPFLVSADTAARCIVAGLNSNRFEISFPRRMTYLMKILRLLPYSLYFPLIRRITGI